MPRWSRDVHKRRPQNPSTQIKPLVAHTNQVKNGIHVPQVSSNTQQEHNSFGYKVVLRWCLMLVTLFLVMILIQLLLLPFPSEERDDTHFQFLRRSREPIHYLRPKNMTTLIDPQYFCDNNHRLLIMVASAPSNTEQRQAIRETWGQANFEIRIIFFMGRSSDGANDMAERQLESAKHGDIVVEDFIDTHENLTLKTLFMLKWTFKHCNQFSYWVKTSDDVLLNTKGILKHLEHFGLEKKPMIIGYRKENQSPERSRTSSSYMPLWLYESKVYPDHVAGSTYLISRGGIALTYLTALTMSIVPQEEVYLTGLVANDRLKMLVRHEARICDGRPIYSNNPCLYHHLFSARGFPPQDLRRLWKILSVAKFKDCDSTYARFLSRIFGCGEYKYDADAAW